MGDRTKIEWATATWNPMTGCTPVSEACEHCYAERIAGRNLPATRCPECRGDGARFYYGKGPESCRLCHGTGNVGFTPTFHPDRLDTPLHWRRPRRIFVCSMSDLFHEAFTDEQVDRVFDVMTTENHAQPGSWNGERWTWHPLHTFLVLTKRPERMREYMLRRQRRAQEYADKFKACPTERMRNSPAAVAARQQASEPDGGIWLGVTVENQQRADERIPVLLDTPAAVRFVSVEPMLSEVDLSRYLGVEWMDALDGYGHEMFASLNGQVGKLVNWVIVGGETGSGARPMQPEWALDVYRQCQAAGVPFFFKKWGRVDARGLGGEYEAMEATRELPAVTL